MGDKYLHKHIVSGTLVNATFCEIETKYDKGDLNVECKNSMSRRSFVTNAAAATGLGLSASLWSKRVLGVGRRTRVGFIGVGSRGTALLRAILKCQNAEIGFLCDVQKLATRKALGEVKKANVPYSSRVKLYTNWHQALEDPAVETVFIATPQYLHVPMALEAVDGKFNIYCEKALGYNIQECFDIKKAVEKSNCVFQVGHQRHYSELYRNAKERIDDDEIGPITLIRGQWHRNSEDRRPCIDPKKDRLVNWRVYSEFTGGLLSEFGAHQIDVVNWFLGSPPVSVTGMGGIDWYQDGRDVKDNVSIIYTYPNGVKFMYSSILTNSHNGALEQFMGTRGTIETSLLFGGRRFTEPKERATLQLTGTPIPCHQSQAEASGDPMICDTIRGSAPRPSCVPKAEKMGAHSPKETLNAVKSFIDCCQKGEKPHADINAGCEAAVAALMGNLAIEEDRTVYWSEFVDKDLAQK